MPALSTLKKEAQSYTKWRGHRMQWQRISPLSLMGQCRDCGRWVRVTINQCDRENIAGQAVKTNCNPTVP